MGLRGISPGRRHIEENNWATAYYYVVALFSVPFICVIFSDCNPDLQWSQFYFKLP